MEKAILGTLVPLLLIASCLKQNAAVFFLLVMWNSLRLRETFAAGHNVAKLFTAVQI